MNLTDDQIRSLREAAEKATPEGCDPAVGWDAPMRAFHAAADPATVLALVEEVERLRELVESATGENIARDVQERIDALHAEDADIRWRRLVSALSITAAKAIANGRWAVAENRRADALAAKAEAGKGLLEYAWHKDRCRRRYGDACSCGFDAALARWEAANG